MSQTQRTESLFPSAMLHGAIVGTVLMVGLASAGQAQRPGPPGPAFTRGTVPDTIAAVVIHPIVAAPFTCSEHPFYASYPVVLGDAAAADCIVVRYDLEGIPRRPPRYFENEGRKNEDWFGWREPLLAPFDGTIDEVRAHPVVNEPGTPGSPPAGFIVFLRSDGTRVVYGHVQEVMVKQGDTVKAGQPVATVGNNGIGYMPHTHVGAWKGRVPLQIRIDLKVLSQLETARMNEGSKGR